MITVKLTTEHPQWPLLRQTPGGEGIWEDVRFVVNQPTEVCDWWVVCDGLAQPETTDCPPEHTLLITWEPPTIRGYTPQFLRQFHRVITCQRELRHPQVAYSQQAHPWFVGRSYDQLQGDTVPTKTKLLSVISSNKNFTPGHQRRLEFALRLKERLGNAVDLFGKGLLDFADKWDVLAPYKYSIALENLAHPDWLTEKLPDCYLTGTFPFYWGCTNVGQYFPTMALVSIDVNDFDSALALIETTLAQPNHYADSISTLRSAKTKYLNELQLFPLIARIIRQSYSMTRHTSLTIRPDTQSSRSISTRIRAKMRGWVCEINR